MAKIAKCGYGSRGQGVGANAPDGYAYVVNDSVNKGDVIQVISTSRNGRKFPTTAVPLSTAKMSTPKGQEIKQQALKNLEASNNKRAARMIDEGKFPPMQTNELTEVQSGKELGAKGYKTHPISAETGKPLPSEYQMQTRAKAVEKYKQSHPNVEWTENAQKTAKIGTYAEYAKYFMNKGEQE